MISFQEAQEQVMAAAAPLGVEARGLREAFGMVLAEPVVASSNLPPFDNSAMDGYAVRADDVAGASATTPVQLALTGAVAAGSLCTRPVQPGEAVQIMTGAPLPPGADTVVILEEAKRRDGVVIVDHPVPQGRHIRRSGEDVAAGLEVLPAGRRLRAAEMALLASLGSSTVKVSRPPRVAVLATGSELVGIDEPLRPGTIRDSNSWVLESYLRPLGVPVVPVGVVPDDEPAVRDAFWKASDCDVILSSGGVSVGEHDLVKHVLIEELAFETIFWRVRMKPGKPLLFGRLPARQAGLNGKLLFGLPGNPISCAVCFVVLIAPALRKMMGDPNPWPARRRAVLRRPLALKERQQTHFLTAQMECATEPPGVTPTPHQGSGMLTSMTEGNAFIVVPEGVTELPAGAEVEVIPDA